MCGILGAVGELARDTQQMERALRTIRHRGPDGSGTVSVETAGTVAWFGHARLSIIDLSAAGHQPMQSADGRWWLTFNGEIFNHQELRADLRANWRGHSDTETLVEALAAWGVDKTLNRLNGMFAFAALDLVSGKLHLARDHFGIKPLYFSESQSSGAFSFASEVRALTVCSGASSSVDLLGLQTFLTLRYVPSPHTLFQGVSRLEPGHLLTYSLAQRRVEVSSWASPLVDRFPGSIAEAVTSYTEIFRTAVRRQLLSDVPVGLLLSGGIDSAMLAAFAAEDGIQLPCYTVGFGGEHSECEISDAEETARVLQLPFHSVLMTAESIWDAFESSVESVEEPLGTTSILPMWDLIKRARQDVTVVLTGQGSDEPWGGYRRYQGEIWRSALPLPLLSLLGALAPVANSWRAMPDHLRRAIQSIPLSDQAARFEAAYALFTTKERLLLTGDDQSGHSIEAIRYWLDWANANSAMGAEAMMRIDARMGLADDLLLYADKISMAHSLEARVPMLDVDLVKFVESLPLSYRVSLTKTKIVHKLAAARLLPARIVQRRKKGFQVPFGTWIRDVWKDRIAALLFDAGSPHLKLLDHTAIRHIWNEHQLGKRDNSRQLFALASLALWSKRSL